MGTEELDKFQQEIAAGMTRAFDDPATDVEDLDLDAARLVIFSDHHKGARDGADDFRHCERAYHAALGYYLERGHRLIALGDVEELWENTPDEVLKAYPATLELEGEFHKEGRYERFWGNHDDEWRHPGSVAKRLDRFYPGIRIRERHVERGHRHVRSLEDAVRQGLGVGLVEERAVREQVGCGRGRSPCRRAAVVDVAWVLSQGSR